MNNSTKNYNFPDLDHCWRIAESNLKNFGASDQSIQSFNAFIQRNFPKAIYKIFDVNVNIGCDFSRTFKAKCVNVVVKKPVMLNNDIDVKVPPEIKANSHICRLLKCSLVSPIYLKLDLYLDNKHEQINNVLLCYVPIMVGSDLTLPRKKLNITDDSYFILNGSEKVIVVQEKKIDKCIVVAGNKCLYRVPTIRSYWWLEKKDDTICICSKYGHCWVAVLFAHFDVPLDTIYPVEIRDETKYLLEEKEPNYLRKNFKLVFPKQTSVNLKCLFDDENAKNLSQLIYMCYALKHNLDVYDRDHISMKRIEMPSDLLLAIGEKSLKRVVHSFQRRMLTYIEKYPHRPLIKGVARAIDNRVVTESFFYALQTGNWVAAKGNVGMRTGVCQQRSNYNFSSILAQSRRFKSGDERRSIIGQREVHGSHRGYLCCYDTAEGKSCGVNKHFASLTNVSLYFDEKIVIENILKEQKIQIKEQINVSKDHLVFVNGLLICQLIDADHLQLLYRTMKQYRRVGIFDRGISVYIIREHLYIRTDAGRLLRPLFVVDNLLNHFDTSRRPLSDNFKELLDAGIIEYVDSQEEDTLIVAESMKEIVKGKHALCEIHPCLFLSLNTNYGCVYPNHNQGPRITYQDAMQKQSQSTIQENFKDTMYSRSHYLLYAQKPLVTTKLQETEGFPISGGLNPIVAIAPYNGYNIEDSLVMKKSFIERGGYRMLDIKTTSYAGAEVITGENVAGQRRYNESMYAQVDDDGLPVPGKILNKDDIIIAKYSIGEDEEKTDTSKKTGEKFGRVMRVIVGHGTRRRKGPSEDSAKVNVVTYCSRQPEVGDKFASR